MSERIKVKVILLGSTGVGKTSFIQVINNQEIDGFGSSTGLSFSTFELDDSQITYEIYDTAGQEAYRSIIQNYYRKSKVVILFAAFDNEKSDEDLLYYYDSAVQKIGKENFLPIFILNKIDLADGEQQLINNRKEEIERKVKEHDPSLEDSFHFFAISCKTRQNVEDTLQVIDQISTEFMSKHQEPEPPIPEPENFLSRMKKKLSLC